MGKEEFTKYFKKLNRTGKTSFWLVIPKQFLKKLKIDADKDILKISLEGNKIIITKFEE